MKKEQSNLLKYFLWFFYLPFYYTIISICNLIFSSVEPFRSYPFKSIHHLSLAVSLILIAGLLFFGYLKLSPQPIFNKDKKLNNKEIFFLILRCLCFFVVSNFITSMIFYPSTINSFLRIIARYKTYPPNVDTLFVQRYYFRFYILVTNIIAPIFEEIIYRRVIYDSIKRHSNSIVLAAIISTICFAIIHFHFNQDAIYNAHYLVSVFFDGLILVYCYHKTNRILPCMIIHFVWNAYVLFFDYFNNWYLGILYLALFLISLAVIIYVFVRYLLKLYQKHVASQEATHLVEMSSQVSHASSNNCPKLFSRLRRKALLPILFLSCLFESLIVMQTIIMIFRLSVDYKIVWYASIQLAFFVVAVLYMRDCHVSLSDVLVKKSVYLNWPLIVKFLCATFVLCFVFFYLPNVSRFGSVIRFFKNNNTVLDLSIFNFADGSPIAFIIFIFIAPIIEQMIFKFGVCGYVKNKSRIIPIAMFISFVVFGLLYTLRLGFTLTELTVIFCVKLFLLYAHEKSESMLTCVVLQFFITVILFLNRYLFFVYSAPVFSTVASVSVVVLGFTLIDFLRRRKLDTEHGVDEVVALDVGIESVEKAVVESSDLDE